MPVLLFLFLGPMGVYIEQVITADIFLKMKKILLLFRTLCIYSRVPDFECDPRCRDEPWLCTASTDPYKVYHRLLI